MLFSHLGLQTKIVHTLQTITTQTQFSPLKYTFSHTSKPCLSTCGSENYIEIVVKAYTHRLESQGISVTSNK